MFVTEFLREFVTEFEREFVKVFASVGKRSVPVLVRQT